MIEWVKYMFIVAFFLEYVLFFILLLLLCIQLLALCRQIIIKNGFYLPSILLGIGLNFLFFDLFTDPIIGVRTSLLGLLIGLAVALLLSLFFALKGPSFYLFLAICAFLGLYRIWGFFIIYFAVLGTYLVFNGITHCRYLPRIKCFCSNGFLVCISGLIYCIIVLI